VISHVSSPISEIIALLRKLKKGNHWLLNFILDSGDEPKYHIDAKTPADLLLLACSHNLVAKILQELKGIEREYKTNGYPAGFESLFTSEVHSLEKAVVSACNEQSVDYTKLTSIQKLFLTHFRCPFCYMLPLYLLDMTTRRAKCKQCGQRITLRKSGKYGKLRASIAKKLNYDMYR